MGIERLTSVITLVAGTFGVATLVGLHCLPAFGGVDPVDDMLSEYPLQATGIGVAFAVALLLANLAVAATGLALTRGGLLRGGPERAALVVWCLGLLGLTVFLKDPTGVSGTPFGMLHRLCTTANFAAMPALCGLLWWRFRATPWARPARVVGGLGVAGLLCATPFVFGFLLRSGHDRFAGLAAGLFERGVVVLDVLVVVTLVWWGRAMARPARRPLPAPTPVLRAAA